MKNDTNNLKKDNDFVTIDKEKELNELKDNGVLTDEEFDKAKKKILESHRFAAASSSNAEDSPNCSTIDGQK